MKNKANHCAQCQEDFVQNFSFCPICGGKFEEDFSDSNIESNESGFHITIVEAKNVKQRNLLLLGAVFMMTTISIAGVIYSIFNKSLDLSAVEIDDGFAFVADIDPVTFDPAEDLKKDKKKSGGGGGGRNDKNPVQKGREATQTDKPLFSPSKDYVRLTNPEIKIQAATEGTKQNKLTDEPYGLPKGGSAVSDGQGCCGGQGNGTRRGQGDDDGNGLGPGKNAGSGGDGSEKDGGNSDPDKDKDIPKVVTGAAQAIKIISKPRASYTNDAREKLVQGKVVLKVTFLANGEIGPITVISGLAGGLTEQAIAAARAIRFEPAKIGSKPVSMTKTVEYTFSIF